MFKMRRAEIAHHVPMMTRSILTFLLATFALTCAPAATPKLPGERESKALVLDSLLAFHRAVQAKDFTEFHAQVSKLWQEQITPAQLQEIFKTFIEQQIDIAFISNAEPLFDQPPSINDDGVLVLAGHYATTPNKVDFRLQYVSEKSAWKLLGIKVNVLPAGSGEGKLPSEKELRALVLESLGDFNNALQGKNFAAFYKHISALWQKQTTPEKLQALFQPFIDKEIDLAPVLKLTPAYEPPPAINDDGLLQIKGTFATKPHQVLFQLGYIFEPPDWKLVKINVKVAKADDDDE